MTLKEAGEELISAVKDKVNVVVDTTKNDIKESPITIKAIIMTLIIMILAMSYTIYSLYNHNDRIAALQIANSSITKRMSELDKQVSMNKFEYLEVINNIEVIKKNLDNQLKSIREEVKVHEIKTDSDVINELNDVASFSNTGLGKDRK